VTGPTASARSHSAFAAAHGERARAGRLDEAELAVEVCPGCGAPRTVTVGTRSSARSGSCGGSARLKEQLYRCAEDHVYSVRVSEEATTELHESVEAWLRSRTADALERRPASSS
jgi:hypothetical protein